MHAQADSVMAEQKTADKPATVNKKRKRQKRELVLIVSIALVVALLTFAENRLIRFGADFPVSNTILMFILININLLLLILLIFLVFRNLVKLFYERKRSVMGSKLRTKLVVAFITLTLLPTTVLFFFSINFITGSIKFWFNVPVEQALNRSLQVGRRIYSYAEENNRFFLERIAYQLNKKKLYQPERAKRLFNYIQVVQREFNLDAVEVYSANLKRISFAPSAKLESVPLRVVAAANLQKPTPASGVHTVTKDLAAGELIRTIGTVPFAVPPDKASAFVVLNNLIPPNLSADMASILRGVEEYQQIKLLKKPIQITYYMTLSIVALLVVFAAIWFGFFMAKSITIPIMELAEGTRRVAEGDLSFAIALPPDDEIGSLVTSFNRMTQDLRVSREQLELSAGILRQQNIEIEEKRKYMEIVLKDVSAGVVTVDAKGYVTTINKSAERMLQLKADEVRNQDFQTMLNAKHLNIADKVMENLTLAHGDSTFFSLRLTLDGRPRSFLVHANTLKNEAGELMGMVMVLDDLTELEKAQRMAAWREVARRIAHEVKNPLTPITLSAQRLKRKYADQINEPVFEECTRMIIEHVDLIRNLVNEFSTFARFPSADPKPCAMTPIIEETVALYREGHQDIDFKISCPDNIPQLSLDRQQIKQAMINLVDNAVAAIKNHGTIMISLAHDPILKMVRLEVADDGPGISDEAKTRIFEPNFSTKTAGMGLGLTIVNSIIADHSGMIRVRDNQPSGAKFVIELPVRD